MFSQVFEIWSVCIMNFGFWSTWFVVLLIKWHKGIQNFSAFLISEFLTKPNDNSQLPVKV